MINVNNGFFVEEDKLTEAENESLEGRFNEEEIKKVVFESYPDGALDLMAFLLCSIRPLGR
jgi:hypothetical protein